MKNSSTDLAVVALFSLGLCLGLGLVVSVVVVVVGVGVDQIFVG